MKTRFTVIALAALVLQSAACFAQVEIDARKIADVNKNAVVTVDIVVEAKMTYEGETEKTERKHTTTATIIDPSGLAVASLVQVAPDAYADLAQKDDGYNYSFETKDVKIKTADGTEIASDIVLRDRDLDLAFIRPKVKPETPLAYLDLANSSTPQLLDQLVVISRLGQAVNRTTAARLDRIEAIATKPRTVYVVNSSIHDELGVPAFTLDGKCAGILVIRYNASSMASSNGGAYIVVLPCSTVSNAAQQAKQAKAPVKAPTTKTPAKTTPTAKK